MVCLSTIIALAATSLAVVASPSGKQSLIQDVVAIDVIVKNLNSVMHHVPTPGGSPVKDLEDINLQMIKLKSAIKQGITDAKNIEISGAGATHVLQAYERIEHPIFSALDTLVSKKGHLKGDTVRDAVRSDLTDLRNDLTALGIALVKAFPNNLKSTANKTKTLIDDAFSKAIAAFE